MSDIVIRNGPETDETDMNNGQNFYPELVSRCKKNKVEPIAKVVIPVQTGIQKFFQHIEKTG